MPEQSSTAHADQRALNIARVSTLTATAIAVADMIGIGVFTSLGFQVRGLPSAFSLIMLWVVGGITALCGALAYAELAAALPRSGGEYNFLSRIYHPAVGFLAGWISATVGFAAPIAVAAMAFGTYFMGAVPGFLGNVVSPGVASLLLGLALAWIVSLVHLTGVRHGGLFQNISTAIKVVLIAAFIVAGFAIGTPQPISFAPSAQDIGYILSAPFAISLVFVMYSYSGWNAATYIINEVRDPEKALPRSLLAATLIVLVLYVALNAVFLYTTPMEKMAGQINVAQIAGAEIFGDAGGRVVAALICIGLVSAVSAMVWIGPRVNMVIGEDIPALRFFARTTKNRGSHDGHPFPARGRKPAALHPELRGRHRLHPVQPDLLHLPRRARRHCAPAHAAGSAASLLGVGLSGDPRRLPPGHRVHDVLPRDAEADAVARQRAHHARRPRGLWPLPPAHRLACGEGLNRGASS